MTDRLTVLLNGRKVGAVSYRSARLSFTYDESWGQDQDAYRLSLSMPLASAEHGHANVAVLLWGLLR